ncbi:MAG: MFS transporter [Actinomycetota bacterium]
MTSPPTSTELGGQRRSRAVHFGWVSLLQDLGSKMVVPILPLFLALQLGASAFVVGLIDGVGAVSAAIVAPIAGRMSRALPVRWVRAGYGLSSAMKLALAFATTWPAVLGIRVADRAGKGIRDAPRDVLLAEAPAHRHGATFGIQQAMDKTGGFLGPLAGLVAYELSDQSFDAVFVVAFIPCALSVALLWRIPPPPVRPASPDDAAPTSDFAAATSARASPAQRRALAAIALHSLGFVSVSLLLLRALDVDATVAQILIGYAVLRLITAIASYPIGRLVDATSARAISIAGMLVSAGAIALIALATTPAAVWVALGTVGLADAMTRGPVKAWLLSLGPKAASGAVLGDRSAITGIAGLVSSIAVGTAWGSTGQLPLLVAAAVAASGAALAATIAQRDLQG